jgi:hypothetical protein
MKFIELSNSYLIQGPEENLEKAKAIVEDMEKVMAQVFSETLANSGESEAMDARDDIYYESGYQDMLAKIGFSMVEEE